MTPYMSIVRMEFVVTHLCTSRCKHCSVSNTLGQKGQVEKEAAVKAITELSKIYDINFVMTFGGEPLLYADTICAIHETK